MEKTQLIIKDEPEWKAQRPRWGHSFHQICSYMAMFPATIPHYFIQKYTKKGDFVIDPFSGRGTTPLQSCADGRIGIGNDLNPLAYALTSAKIDPPSKKELLERIESLENQYQPMNIASEPDKIQMIFHEKTLSQLVFLKKKLDKTNRADRFITALILGVMHGGSKGFLSVQMPNTFSMSPNYIKKYIAEKKLPKPDRNVFNVLREKIERSYKDSPPETRGYAFNQDVREIHNIKINGKAIHGKVKLLVTSPPYLKVIKYGLYNWIRLWFLDIASEDVDAKLDDAHKIEPYLDFMSQAVKSVYPLMHPESACVFVIGDVNGLNLAEEVWKKIDKDKVGFKKFDIIEDNIKAEKKVTKMWGDKKGKATPTDRLLILYKDKMPPANPVSWSQG